MKKNNNKNLLADSKKTKIPIGSKAESNSEPVAPQPYNVMSIEESAIHCTKQDLERVRRWATKFLIRIYPKGLRIQSDNYNPLFFWKLGCQLVALNYHTPGFPMWLNEGKFMRAKNSGYIQKPERLQKEKVGETNKTEVTYLTIEVISSWRLPRPWGIDTLYSSDKVSRPKVEVSLWDPYTVAFNQFGAGFNRDIIGLPEKHHLNREIFNLDDNKKKEKERAKANTNNQNENSVADDTKIMPYIQYSIYKANEGNPHSDTYHLESSDCLLEKKK